MHSSKDCHKHKEDFPKTNKQEKSMKQKRERLQDAFMPTDMQSTRKQHKNYETEATRRAAKLRTDHSGSQRGQNRCSTRKRADSHV